MHWAVLLDFNTIAPVTFKLPNIITLTRHSNISCQEMLFRGSGLNAMIAVRHDFLWLSVGLFSAAHIFHIPNNQITAHRHPNPDPSFHPVPPHQDETRR